MSGIWEHLRNKLVAGMFAAVPVAIVVYVAVWVESATKVLAEPVGMRIPGLGIVIAVAGVYVLGVVVTSVLGRFVLGLANEFFRRVPGLRLLYQGWKDLLVVPPDQAGIFHQAVLVPVGEGRSQVGFTSGRTLPGDPASLCVFLPNIPNPFSGRLVVIPKTLCLPLKMSVEEALKFQLSSGNYLPPTLAGPSAADRPPDAF
jgi:uncharacterized membrane protein